MGKVLPKKRGKVARDRRSNDAKLIRKRRTDLTLARITGERMRDLRLALGMTLAQLYERGAPTPGQMSAIENGKVDFTVETIVNVAGALRVRPWQLLTNDALLAFDLDEARRILFVLPDVSVLEPPPTPKRAKAWDHVKARKGGKL